jgi:hypothetical protein
MIYTTLTSSAISVDAIIIGTIDVIIVDTAIVAIIACAWDPSMHAFSPAESPFIIYLFNLV